jgi:hypothetical protein
MPKSKTAKKEPTRRGPKLIGAEKRVRTTLTFDKQVLKHAKPHVKKLGMSLSGWLEELMRPHLPRLKKP